MSKERHNYEGPSINYLRIYWEEEVKPSIHINCVLHAKNKGGGVKGVQIACTIAYVLMEDP